MALCGCSGFFFFFFLVSFENGSTSDLTLCIPQSMRDVCFFFEVSISFSPLYLSMTILFSVVWDETYGLGGIANSKPKTWK
jgi:hypothetical protein